MFADSTSVKIIRWPAEAEKREHCRKLGIPRLLIVEGGAIPPLCADVAEDWIRAPVNRDEFAASQEDLRMRISVVQARWLKTRVPEIDESGVLRFGKLSVVVSPTERRLMVPLVENFGSLTKKNELSDCLAGQVPPTRNALHLHIMRIRRRVNRVGLSITTIWGRGYVLGPDGGTHAPGRTGMDFFDTAVRAAK